MGHISLWVAMVSHTYKSHLHVATGSLAPISLPSLMGEKNVRQPGKYWGSRCYKWPGDRVIKSIHKLCEANNSHWFLHIDLQLDLRSEIFIKFKEKV